MKNSKNVKNKYFKYAALALIIISFICVNGVKAVRAEFEDKNIGVRSSSMGGAYTGLADDGEAQFYNPAGIALVKRGEFTSMHTSLYGQSDLPLDYFNFTQPLLPFAITSFGMTRFGSGLYKESEQCLTIARLITERHAFGLSLKQLSTNIENTPEKNGFSMDFGAMVKFQENFRAGVSIINLNNPKMNETVPKTFKLGVAFMPKENLTLCLDYSKQSTEGKGNISLGEEFKMTRNFKVRAGYNTYPSRLSAGFGFEFKNIKLDYGFRNHDTLNSTHRVSFTYMMD